MVSGFGQVEGDFSLTKQSKVSALGKVVATSAKFGGVIDTLAPSGPSLPAGGILGLQPAAAYSLRSFDADADPNVVNVRRSSDGATSDFTASEVSDGTLTDWVNTEYNLYSSDFSSGVDGWGTGNSSVDGNQDSISDGTTSKDDCLKITSLSDSQSYADRDNGVVAGYSYRVTGEAYVPDSNSAYDSIAIKDGISGEDFPSGYIVSNGSWVSFSFEYTATVSGEQRVNLCKNGVSFITAIAGADGDVGYIRNLNFTQLTADGYVTTWYDQSDNGNDLTQTTASAQPKIVDAGTLVTDSSNNPAIIGDGVDDTLSHPTLTDELDSSDFLITAAYEDEVAMGIIGSVPRLYLTRSSMSYNTLGTVTYPSQTGRNVISFQVAGNTQEVFGNGASLGTASEAQVDLGENMFNVLQGGSSFSDGPLMEVVVFGDNQSANRTVIENNINDHFNIYS